MSFLSILERSGKIICYPVIHLFIVQNYGDNEFKIYNNDL